jgi:hypothetical protein
MRIRLDCVGCRPAAGATAVPPMSAYGGAEGVRS